MWTFQVIYLWILLVQIEFRTLKTWRKYFFPHGGIAACIFARLHNAKLQSVLMNKILGTITLPSYNWYHKLNTSLCAFLIYLWLTHDWSYGQILWLFIEAIWYDPLPLEFVPHQYYTFFKGSFIVCHFFSSTRQKT